MLKEIVIIEKGGIVNKFTHKREDHKKLMLIKTDEQDFVIDLEEKVELTNRMESIAIYCYITRMEVLYEQKANV